MAKTHDIVATIGTYQKDGQTKYVTRNVGSVIQTEKGTKIKLDASFNPAGCVKSEDGGVWLAMFEPRENSQQSGSSPAPQASDKPGGDQYETDIPFVQFERNTVA